MGQYMAILAGTQNLWRKGEKLSGYPNLAVVVQSRSVQCWVLFPTVTWSRSDLNCWITDRIWYLGPWYLAPLLLLHGHRSLGYHHNLVLVLVSVFNTLVSCKDVQNFPPQGALNNHSGNRSRKKDLFVGLVSVLVLCFARIRSWIMILKPKRYLAQSLLPLQSSQSWRRMLVWNLVLVL